MTLEALQNKLKAFLDLRTADGPRHDTYLIFYSGHTLRTGAWAMAGQDTVIFCVSLSLCLTFSFLHPLLLSELFLYPFLLFSLSVSHCCLASFSHLADALIKSNFTTSYSKE